MLLVLHKSRSNFFFFNHQSTSILYILSLHDALPISVLDNGRVHVLAGCVDLIYDVRASKRDVDRKTSRLLARTSYIRSTQPDRKSTRLNSSHSSISYAVFCLKKTKVLTSSSCK